MAMPGDGLGTAGTEPGAGSALMAADPENAGCGGSDPTEEGASPWLPSTPALAVRACKVNCGFIGTDLGGWYDVALGGTLCATVGCVVEKLK